MLKIDFFLFLYIYIFSTEKTKHGPLTLFSQFWVVQKKIKKSKKYSIFENWKLRPAASNTACTFNVMYLSRDSINEYFRVPNKLTGCLSVM